MDVALSRILLIRFGVSFSRNVGSLRVFGTVLLIAGILVSLLTMTSDTDRLDPHLLAGFLVLTGVGMRIEAAIIERRS